METYQPIYDGVRSRISNGDIGYAVERAISEANIGHYFMLAGENLGHALDEYQRPSAVYRPTLTLDGNQFCALYGLNLMEGIAGFGDTAAEAMLDFDKNWKKQKAPVLK